MPGPVLIVHADGTYEGLEEVRAHLLSPGRIATTRNFVNALLKMAPPVTTETGELAPGGESKSSPADSASCQSADCIALPLQGCPTIENIEHLERIRERATAFRAAIEACDKTCLCDSFEEFPAGSCGDASCLLGKYLMDCGLGQFFYVAGSKKRSNGTHAWIEQDGLIIDITADQFRDVNIPVWLTRERDWHQKFNVSIARKEAQSYFNGSGLARDYAEIRRLLS